MHAVTEYEHELSILLVVWSTAVPATEYAEVRSSSTGDTTIGSQHRWHSHEDTA